MFAGIHSSSWILYISWLFVASGVLSAALISIDIASGRRQHMRIMDVTWPITGFYAGPAGWWIYRKIGRSPMIGKSLIGRHGNQKPFWKSVFVSVTHCGGGCTVGDAISAASVSALSITIAGSFLFTSYTLDFILAYAFGILFQYLPVREMGEKSRKVALLKAVKADSLSLSAFEAGLFGWTAAWYFIIFHGPLPIAGPVFWFMMQIGMAIGFGTAYPANWWLVKWGIKSGM